MVDKRGLLADEAGGLGGVASSSGSGGYHTLPQVRVCQCQSLAWVGLGQVDAVRCGAVRCVRRESSCLPCLALPCLGLDRSFPFHPS